MSIARARGFTLLEVVIAVMLLALSLTALLQVQTRNISQTAQARDMTVAVALARSKVIDIEQRLFHEGFQTGDLSQEGDFADEGYPHVSYRYQVSEVELDLDKLGQAVGSVAKRKGADASQSEGEFESMFGAVSVFVSPLIQTIAKSLRVVDLDVTWSAGRARPHFSLRALLSQDDFSSMATSDLQKTERQLQEGAAAAQPPGAAGTTY